MKQYASIVVAIPRLDQVCYNKVLLFVKVFSPTLILAQHKSNFINKIITTNLLRTRVSNGN